MTVCIAAICESGKAIVVATDRMFTAPFPVNVEFETEERKIEELSSNCVALVSGDSGSGTEVLAGAREKLRHGSVPTVSEIAKTVKDEYISARSRKVDETIIAPTLGLDFVNFLAKGGTLPAYLQVQPQVYQQLVAVAQQYNMGLDILVAGIDDSGAHVLMATHPGTLVWLDKLGYHAIGSGGIHALTRLYLGAQTSHRGLFETLYSVYDAKKASEAAPGVGKVTDLMVLEASKDGIYCSESVLEELEHVHSETSQRYTPDLSQLEKVLNG